VDTLPWEIAAKALTYAALLTATGTCAIQLLRLPRLAELPTDEDDATHAALAPMRTRLAGLVLVALGLHAVAHVAAIFGWADVLSWDAVHTVAIASRWGTAWDRQVGAALGFFLASLWAGAAPREQRVRGIFVAIACVALCYAMPLLGHGAGSRWRMVLHGTHILGSGIWAGTLMALVVIRLPLAHRLALLRQITPLALLGTGILVLCGVAMAWSYVGTPSNLWTTTYGQLLVLKLACFAGAATCGFANWRRFAAERRGAAHHAKLRIVTLETVLLTLIITVTAVLTEVAHP
jgi:putative copper resistance protein D